MIAKNRGEGKQKMLFGEACHQHLQIWGGSESETERGKQEDREIGRIRIRDKQEDREDQNQRDKQEDREMQRIRIREISRETGRIRIRDKQEDRETGRIGRRGDSRKQRYCSRSRIVEGGRKQGAERKKGVWLMSKPGSYYDPGLEVSHKYDS